MRQISTASEMRKMAQDRANVRGTYFGVPFAGVAIRMRSDGLIADVGQLLVKLDETITVRGAERDEILLFSREISTTGFSIERAD